MSYTKHNFASGDTLYASQLNEMENQIAANETANTNLGNRLSTAENNVSTLNNNVTALTNRIGGFNKNTRALFIGDSYSWGTGATINAEDTAGKGWPWHLVNRLGIEMQAGETVTDYIGTYTENKQFTLVHMNGGGFSVTANAGATFPQQNFADIVSSLNANAEYDYIIVQTGYNDATRGTVAGIKSNINTFVTNIRQKYPNSKLVILPVYYDKCPFRDTTSDTANVAHVNQYIRLVTVAKTAMENDVFTCFDSMFWLQNSNTNSETFPGHPNDEGYELLSRYIYQYLNGWSGHVDFQRDITDEVHFITADDAGLTTEQQATYNALAWRSKQIIVTRDSIYFTGQLVMGSGLPNGLDAWTNVVDDLPVVALSAVGDFHIYNSTTYGSPLKVRLHTTGKLVINHGAPGIYDIYLTAPFTRNEIIDTGVA